MSHPVAYEVVAPSPVVLGRLLVIQQAIDALPDEVHIADFTRSALLLVPGVADAYVHLYDHTVPPNPQMQGLLETCEEALRQSSPLKLLVTDNCPGVHFFPIETPVHKFGMLLARVADESLLRPYVAFLGNISNAISRVLEVRMYEARLGQANEELRRARDDLEIRVAERTRELEYHATHDQLTGLVNRALLVDRLAHEIANARREGLMLAVIYLDLDSFTFLNTGLGNPYGDKFLQETARRLSGLVCDGDTFARIGSDQFVILLTGLKDVARSSARLNAVLAAVREPMPLGDKDVVVTCSIGACFYPLDGQNGEILLRRANAAMHRAKASGKDDIQFYAAARDAAVSERMGLETELRQAIPNGAMRLYYQPKLDLVHAKVVGAEALVRWEHPKKGLLPPSIFIPVAEDSALIITLGEWVMLQACLQAKAWQEAGTELGSIAVNLAARQFRDGRIVETVRRVLLDTGLEPNRLELEITESSIMHDLKQATALMHRLKELGVAISIDDFGTGYSSLSALRNFPADKLKIDCSFVQEIETVPSAAAVALAVIAVGKSLGMRVIAEGVATAGQADFLKRHGCDEIQGELVACPLSSEQFQALLNQPFSAARNALSPGYG